MRSNKQLKLPGLTLLSLFVIYPLGPVLGAQGTDCALTKGSSQAPSKAFPPADHWYGSERLAVVLPPDGIWRGMGPTHNFRDKLFWWSAGFKPGSESNLKVAGVRLDGDAPAATISRVTTAHAESLGGWTMLVMVEFPSAGCWQITGEYLGEKLTFVVEAQAGEPSTD